MKDESTCPLCVSALSVASPEEPFVCVLYSPSNLGANDFCVLSITRRSNETTPVASVTIDSLLFIAAERPSAFSL